MKRENVTVLGSTGSIGVNTLDVIGRNPDHFRVVALSARQNIEKLAEQCAKFDVRLAVTADPLLEQDLADALKRAGARAIRDRPTVPRSPTLPIVQCSRIAWSRRPPRIAHSVVRNAMA